MAILSGRFGKVMWSASGGASPTRLISLNAFTLSMATDFEDVTTFGKSNKTYIPGLRDLSGSLSGFWDSDDIDLIQASQATTPGLLELEPNENEPGFIFSGLAYMDVSLDCNVNAAPKISANFRAADSWSVPAGSVS